MIDAERAQDRRVEIVDVYRIFDDVVAEVVGLAVDEASLIPPPASQTLKLPP